MTDPDAAVPGNPPIERLLGALKDLADALVPAAPIVVPDDGEILTALSTDAEDETTSKLLVAMHDEDEGSSS